MERPGAGPADAFRVRAPAEGDRWCLGRRHRILWNPSHPSFPGGRVRLELGRRGSAFTWEIAGSTENDGEFRWRLPPDLEPGADYRVRVARLREEGDPFAAQPADYSEAFDVAPCADPPSGPTGTPTRRTTAS